MKYLYIMGICLLLISCNNSEEWTPLFNGKDLSGWHVYGPSQEFNGWHVDQGMIVFDPKKRTEPINMELVTDSKYTNFEISLEWKVGDYGNSGLMWGVVEDEAFEHAYVTGPEIQILNENWEEYIEQNGDIARAGSLYGLMPPKSIVSKKGDQWNHYLLHIDQKANVGWLDFNGERVLDFPVNGKEWEDLISESRFSESKFFGRNQTGHIVLQEFGGKVMFKDLKIRQLD